MAEFKFYKENSFKPCLTKQLLNMFKLWCERGIRFVSCQSDSPYLITISLIILPWVEYNTITSILYTSHVHYVILPGNYIDYNVRS